MDALLDVVRAVDFAARKHVHKRRKGADAEPYVNHLAEVALLIARATGGRDPALVIAALLHDTIEDTDTSRAELVREFGEDVARLVTEVSDDKALPRAERKQLQVAHAPALSSRAKLLKLADKISNLRSILRSPPATWEPQRKWDYFAWAQQVVAGCRGVNPGLEEEFDRLCREGAQALGRAEASQATCGG